MARPRTGLTWTRRGKADGVQRRSSLICELFGVSTARCRSAQVIVVASITATGTAAHATSRATRGRAVRCPRVATAAARTAARSHTTKSAAAVAAPSRCTLGNPSVRSTVRLAQSSTSE